MEMLFLMIADSQTPDNLFALIWVALNQMPGASSQKGVSQKIKNSQTFR